MSEIWSGEEFSRMGVQTWNAERELGNRVMRGGMRQVGAALRGAVMDVRNGARRGAFGQSFMQEAGALEMGNARFWRRGTQWHSG